MSVFDFIKVLVTKLHFIAGLVMFAFVAMMVVTESMAARALLLLPVVIFYSISRALFAMDQASMVQDILDRQKKN